MLFTAALPARAREWVTVSSWAYNDVSNFTKDDLLPESFDDVSDYTQDITRLQFAELLYQTLLKGDAFMLGYNTKPTFYQYDDTVNDAARVLGDFGLMTGEAKGVEKVSTGTGSTVQFTYSFYPERSLNREEMASVIYRTVQRFCDNIIPERVETGGYVTRAVDEDEISAWAKESVNALKTMGLISGMSDGTFRPKEHLTIEQAIIVLYSVYNYLPATQSADGANLRSAYEQNVQRYANGFTETKQNNTLYLKLGDTVYMEFETDIYSKIDCATINGVTYAAARNMFNKTDVYNVETKEIVFRLPYPVYALGENYIITQSQLRAPIYYGAADYNGNELLPPEYSMSEVEAIAANGYNVPEDVKTEASGWIYYKNESDGGALYRMDTNGENKQKLSDHTPTQLEYINGRLYFTANGGGSDVMRMYSVKPDGSDEQSFRLPKWFDGFVENMYYQYEQNEYRPLYYSTYPIYNSQLYTDGVGAIHGLYSAEIIHYHDDSAIYLTSYDSDEISYTITRAELTENGFEVTNPLEGYDVLGYQVKDGKLYFIDQTEEKAEKGLVHGLDGYLYCYENGTVTKLTDMKTGSFFFDGDELVFHSLDREGHYWYIMNADGTNIRVNEKIEENLFANEDMNIDAYSEVYYNLSDQNYTVDLVENRTPGVWTLYCRDKNGKKKLIDEAELVTRTGQSGVLPVNRIGNTLYYKKNADTQDSQNNDIIAYNMETGESKTVATGVRETNSISGADWFAYTDYSDNIWRYNKSDDTLTEIFPNKGIRKYGGFEMLTGIDGVLYKADKDGNLSKISDETTTNCIYVRNGDKDGIRIYR